MLILTRKPGQLLRIEPRPELDPSSTVGELFRGGPIRIVVGRVCGSQVRLGIQAHPGLAILRDELVLRMAREMAIGDVWPSDSRRP